MDFGQSMKFKFDTRGFYSGYVEGDAPSSTELVPPDDVGRMKPKWDGVQWLLQEDFTGVFWFNSATLEYATSVDASDARSAPWVEVVNGAVTSEMPPTQLHIFNYATKQWVDPRTLQDFKNAKWTEIKAARNAAEYAGFTWDGSTFDSDPVSQQRLVAAVTQAQMDASFSIGWTLKDNSVRQLDAVQMQAVGAALGAHVATQFAHGQGLRARIEAATTAAEVAGMVW
jgi:hypothetical protein